MRTTGGGGGDDFVGAAQPAHANIASTSRAFTARGYSALTVLRQLGRPRWIASASGDPVGLGRRVRSPHS